MHVFYSLLLSNLSADGDCSIMTATAYSLWVGYVITFNLIIIFVIYTFSLISNQNQEFYMDHAVIVK